MEHSLLSRILIATAFLSLAATAMGQPKPAPSPTPRRPLAKPTTARGFEQFAKRDASARLIAAAGTRVIIDPADHFSKGEASYKAGKYEAAIAELREAAKLSPDWDDPHYVLALSLVETGKLKEAIEEYKKVLALAIKDDVKILSHYNLGNAYADLGEYANAIESYKQAIKLDPTLSKPHNNLGLAYAALNRMSEAADEFKAAVRLRPQYAEAHFNLGVAYLQMKRKLEAQDQQRVLVALKSELANKLASLMAN